MQSIIIKNELLNVPVNVVNKPGGGGSIAMFYMEQHAHDGVSLMMQTPELITNSITGISPLGPNDVTPLALLITDPIIFSVAAQSSITSGRVLLQRLKASPESVSIAMSGTSGDHSHIAVALIMKAIGCDPAKLKMVYYISGSECVTALIGNHVDVTITPSSSILGAMEAGLVRPIAVETGQRLPGALSSVPTWQEQGANVVFSSWRGVVGPKEMTSAQKAFWDNVFHQIVITPEWQTYAARNLWVTTYENSKDFVALLKTQEGPLRPMLTELGLAAN
jgi:putative tricarboxylic transport membrane protein